MKTLKAEEGKSLDLKPCLNCVSVWKRALGRHVPLCPCPNFSGERQSQDKGRTITLFNCENRQMPQAPKIKNSMPAGMLRRRSKRKAI